MIATRFMELRKRRGLMIALILVNIGIPTVFLAIRLLLHAFAPHSYGPAGGYDIFTGLVAGVMYVFGFIVAATLGCTAGSVDLTEGMFRHLVVTGRSRLALYLARIPAGLAIIVPLVAIGFTVVCAVCVFAAPTSSTTRAPPCPPACRAPAFETWAARPCQRGHLRLHLTTDRSPSIVPCGNGPGGGPGGPGRRRSSTAPGSRRNAATSPAQITSARPSDRRAGLRGLLRRFSCTRPSR